MKIDENGLPYLELVDIIRINQLVRGGIDFPGFKDWYETLPIPEQEALIVKIYIFACEAGFSFREMRVALTMADLEESDPICAQAGSFEKANEIDWVGFIAWLQKTSAAGRVMALKLFAYAFGISDARRYRSCVQFGCTHWWHRDLLDERVVEAILNDPHFRRTSMKDDKLFKNS